MRRKPDSDDYLPFRRYKEDFGMSTWNRGRAVQAAFRSDLRMLTQPSSFNLSLPEQFRRPPSAIWKATPTRSPI